MCDGGTLPDVWWRVRVSRITGMKSTKVDFLQVPTVQPAAGEK